MTRPEDASTVMPSPSSVRGLLQGAEQFDSHIVATFECVCPHCRAPVTERVALPRDCYHNVEELVGSQTLVVRVGDRYAIRGVSAA